MEKPAIETKVVKPKTSFVENNIEYRMIGLEDESYLDSKIEEIENYIKNNDGKFQSEEYKDELYATARGVWEQMAVHLRSTTFNLNLNKKQFDYLKDLLINDMEYDINIIFFAIELTNMLGEWSGVESDESEESICYPTDATGITYTFHLISKHKVKGLSEESYRFAEVLKKLNSVHKVIEYYDTTAQNLAKDIQKWVADFDPQPQVA